MQKQYEAILGEKSRTYYLTKFEQFDQQGPGFKASWNWPAFLFGGLWALYRKMYGWFFAFLGITFLSSIFEKTVSQGLSTIIFIVPWIVFAIYANSLYLRNIKNKIAVARLKVNDESKLLEYLKKKGGVHRWVIWVFVLIPPIGIVIAVFISNFASYYGSDQSEPSSTILTEESVACELPINSQVGGTRIIKLTEDECIKKEGKIVRYISPLPQGISGDDYISCILSDSSTSVLMKAATCLDSGGEIVNRSSKDNSSQEAYDEKEKIYSEVYEQIIPEDWPINIPVYVTYSSQKNIKSSSKIRLTDRDQRLFIKNLKKYNLFWEVIERENGLSPEDQGFHLYIDFNQQEGNYSPWVLSMTDTSDELNIAWDTSAYDLLGLTNSLFHYMKEAAEALSYEP